MGSCISKCQPNRSSPQEPNLPQDKLVISQSPLIPGKPNLENFSKKQSHSSSSSASSSSSSSSSSLSTSSSSSSSSTNFSKDRSFSNEFLLSCIQKHPHIIVLDPGKGNLTKPKALAVPLQTLQPPAKPIPGRSKQSITRFNQSPPSKRARSPSPSFARQKSFRTEPNSAARSPSRKLRSPSPSRRLTGDACSDQPRNVLRERNRREIELSRNASSLPRTTRKEKLPPSSPSSSSSRQSSRFEKKETQQINRIHPLVGQDGSGVVLSKQSSRVSLMEGIDNPLISMDCFIFL